MKFEDRKSVAENPPRDGQYVLVKLDKDNWDDRGNDDVYFKVVKFVRGMSIAERAALPDTDWRKTSWGSADEEGNNLRPYCWDTFGPSCYFGQEVTHYWDLPTETTK